CPLPGQSTWQSAPRRQYLERRETEPFPGAPQAAPQLTPSVTEPVDLRTASRAIGTTADTAESAFRARDAWFPRRLTITFGNVRCPGVARCQAGGETATATSGSASGQGR